jgi:hypothetical protein
MNGGAQLRDCFIRPRQVRGCAGGNLGPMKADTPGNKGPMKGEIVKGGVVVPT